MAACNHAGGQEMARGSFTAAKMIAELLGNYAAGPNTAKATWQDEYNAFVAREKAWQAAALRDVFGNIFRPAMIDAARKTDTALALARTMYESRDLSAMPILADALQDAGCDNADVLNHCR